MDFLTRPFRPPPRRKSHSGSPPPPQQPPSPTHSSSRKDSISSHASSSHASASASSEASTSHTPVHLDHLLRFSQLRTASPLPPGAGTDGLPGEERVGYPSEAAGDWRAFGRVQGRVVVWEEGTVGVVGEKQLREEEKGVGEWVVEGSLWLTKSDQILLLLDRDHFPPLTVDRAAALAARSSRPSRPPSRSGGGSFSLARRLSRSESGTSTPVVGGGGLGRRRSSVGSLGASGGEGSATPSDGDDDNLKSGTKSPVLGFFKKFVSAVKPHKDSPSAATPGADGELGLQRTRSIEIGRRRASEHRAQLAAQAQVKAEAQPDAHAQAQVQGGAGKGKDRAVLVDDDEEEEGASGDEGEGLAPGMGTVKFEEPSGREKGPLPDYKGYPITALLIPSPSHIHAVRFYPHQTTTSGPHPPSSSFFGSSPAAPDEPVTSPPPPAPAGEEPFVAAAAPEGSIGLDVLLSGGGAGGGTVEGVEWRPPVVEVDVYAPIDDGEGREDEEEQGEREGNKKREATVGFVFKEVLLAQEAATFHHRLLSLLPSRTHSPSRGRSPSPDPSSVGGLGSALMRTLSGGLSRERSREPKEPKEPKESKEKEKEKAREEAVLPPPVPAAGGRRRSSFFGLVGGGSGGGSEGVEPTV
ncbi:hypothetical protein JCM6882_005887 [Rhodosporidiobolus microsporus]